MFSKKSQWTGIHALFHVIDASATPMIWLGSFVGQIYDPLAYQYCDCVVQNRFTAEVLDIPTHIRIEIVAEEQDDFYNSCMCPDGNSQFTAMPFYGTEYIEMLEDYNTIKTRERFCMDYYMTRLPDPRQ